MSIDMQVRPATNGESMKSDRYNLAREIRFAKSLYEDLSKSALQKLRVLIQRHQISVTNGDVKFLDGGWYVTHSGLLRLAERRRCAGIHCRPVLESSDPSCGNNLDVVGRWTMTVSGTVDRQICRVYAQRIPADRILLLQIAPA